MKLNKNIIVNNKEFELVAIKGVELKEGYTMLDIISEAISRDYILPNKTYIKLIRDIFLNKNIIKDTHVQFWVAVYKEDIFPCDQYGAIIVGGIWGDFDSRNIRIQKENPTKKWGGCKEIAFIFLTLKK